MSKKNNYIQDSIYIVRQFPYVHGVAVISQFSRKNTRCGNTVFSLKNNIKTLISKITVFISCTQDSQWATKLAKNFSQGLGPINPSLHSMDQVSKNLPLIKNHNNIISCWIIIQIKPSWTPQNPTNLPLGD